MNAKDEIKELFSDKLGNYEANVNPELWGNIASQVGASAAAGTAGSTGMSLLTKIIIGAGAASAITVGTILAVSDSEDKKTPVDKKDDIALVESSSKKEPVKAQEKLEKTISENNYETKVVQDNQNNPQERNQVSHETYMGVVPSENGSLPVQGAEVITKQDDPVKSVASNGGQKEDNPVKEDRSQTQEQQNTTAEQKDTEKQDKGVQKTDSQTIESNTTVETREIKLPNVFTPDGDGINEELYLLDTGGLTDFYIVVLDQKYNKVFESRDPDFRWNGVNMFTSQPLDKGNYTALVSGKDENGKPIKSKYYPFTIIK